MLRRLAELDYEPLYEEARRTGGKLAMVTLTLPTDWERFAPGPDAVQRYLAAFRRRWERAVGPAIAIWKLEFQRRGAPHIHLLMACPPVVDDEPFAAWLSRRWYEVVGSGDPGHLAAGTAVGRLTPRHLSEAMALATYFAKWEHRGHQHGVPELWWNAVRFRWWGYWRLKPFVQTVIIARAEARDVRRAMRHLHRQQHPGAKRVLCGSRGRDLLGGFLLTPNGPRLAGQLLPGRSFIGGPNAGDVATGARADIGA